VAKKIAELSEKIAELSEKIAELSEKIAELSEKTAALVKKASKTAKNSKEKSVHKVCSNLEPAGGEFVVSVILGAHSRHLCSSLASILVVF
jgi:uncharacterized coiled-coil protein SlyX